MPADELVEDLPAELLHEGLEALAGAGLHEVVLLEAPDPVADVGRQVVELVEALRGGVAEHRPEGRVDRRRPADARAHRAVGALRRRSARRAGRPGRRRPAAAARSRRASTPARSSATISSSSPADVGQHVAELVPVEQLLAPRREPVASGRAGRPCRRGSRSVERQPRSMSRRRAASQVALGHHVVGQRVEDLVGRQVRHGLAAVPAASSGPPGRGPRSPARSIPAARVAQVAPVRRVEPSTAGHRR